MEKQLRKKEVLSPEPCNCWFLGTIRMGLNFINPALKALPQNAPKALPQNAPT